MSSQPGADGFAMTAEAKRGEFSDGTSLNAELHTLGTSWFWSVTYGDLANPDSERVYGNTLNHTAARCGIEDCIKNFEGKIRRRLEAAKPKTPSDFKPGDIVEAGDSLGAFFVVTDVFEEYGLKKAVLLQVDRDSERIVATKTLTRLL